jgi:hypothetical protein
MVVPLIAFYFSRIFHARPLFLKKRELGKLGQGAIPSNLS